MRFFGRFILWVSMEFSVLPSGGSYGDIFAGSVVLHVALNELACSKCRHEGELASENSASDDRGQKPGIGPRGLQACSLHPEQLQTSGLRRQLRPTANRSYLYSGLGQIHEEEKLNERRTLKHMHDHSDNRGYV